MIQYYNPCPEWILLLDSTPAMSTSIQELSHVKSKSCYYLLFVADIYIPT